MRNIANLAFVMALVVLIVGLSACDQLLRILSEDQMTGAAVPQFTDFSGDISVGVVLPLSGRLASSFGVPMDRGLQMALDEINRGQLGDARISFIVEDDMSTVDGAVAAYKKLIDQNGVSVILGPATSSMTEGRVSDCRREPVLLRLVQRPLNAASAQLGELCLSHLARDRCFDTQRN